jgi:hypothetical protein
LEQATACDHVNGLQLNGHLVTLHDKTSMKIVRACSDCGTGWDNDGLEGELGHDDAAALAQFTTERAALRDGIAAAASMSAALDKIPSPIWYPRLGLVPSLEAHRILPVTQPIDGVALREEIRRYSRRAEYGSVTTIHTPVGGAILDQIYEDHFFEVDPGTRKDRCDADHISYVPQLVETLTSPVEIWQVQPRGPKTRRWAFFKLYLQNDSFVYHLAIVTRDRRVLTAHRIQGFSACQTRRCGIPLYMGY